MAHARIIPLFNTHNFRDLGGYPSTDNQIVKWGQIFRAAKLDRLSNNDQQKLVRLGVKVDIDLRSADEVQANPDRLPKEVHYLFDPVFATDLTGSSKDVRSLDPAFLDTPLSGRRHMQNVYHKMMIREDSIKALRTVFQELLSHDGGVVFHCTAGKDRTGMSAYFILRALGVSPEIARKDYLLTNTALKNFVNGQQAALRAAGRSEAAIDNYVALWSADRSYLNSALTTIQDQYHDLNHFFHEALQLSADDLQQLCHTYLESKGEISHAHPNTIR